MTQRSMDHEPIKVELLEAGEIPPGVAMLIDRSRPQFGPLVAVAWPPEVCLMQPRIAKRIGDWMVELAVGAEKERTTGEPARPGIDLPETDYDLIRRMSHDEMRRLLTKVHDHGWPSAQSALGAKE